MLSTLHITKMLMTRAKVKKPNHILILVCMAISMVREYGNGDDQDHFAHAYYREELKANGCNPDIIAQQSGKDSNPHKTKHLEA